MRRETVRKEHIIIIGVFTLIVIACGAAFWLANAPLQPTSQHMHLVLPDERISR